MLLRENVTGITSILLLGFPNLHHHISLTFIMFLMIYWLTICGNLTIIALVVQSKNLHSPMYIFTAQLSVCDILMTTNIIPNVLSIVLNDGGTISLPGCITQFFFFGSSECSECLLLTAMSYDRYLAICNPLHYNSIMNYNFCLKLIIMSWVIGYLVLTIETINICKLWFCGPNVIDHFFCDLTPLLELSCSDSYIVELESNLLSIPVIILPFFIIILSYSCIVFTILRIPSLTGRRKAFSTCSSHLVVVCIFYGALISIYTLPNKAKLENLSKLLSLLYTVVTPLTNPIIYSFRNKDIKGACHKFFRKISVC